MIYGPESGRHLTAYLSIRDNRSRYGKRFILWSAGILFLLLIVAVLAFKFSPWPGVVIIPYAFSRGAKASAAALEKHVPDGIVTRPNIAYGSAKDEVFDLLLPGRNPRAEANNRLGAWRWIRCRQQE